MSERKKGVGGILNSAVNLVALLIMLIALLHPDGLVRVNIREWRDQALVRDTISVLWDDMTNESGIDRTIVEFLDYECPFCRMGHDSVERAETAGLAVVYRHLPLPNHGEADGAARAVICAEGQGHLAAMHKRLIVTTAWQTVPDWGAEAVAAGVEDTTAFAFCLESEETQLRIERDAAFAERLGIRSTPTFVSTNGVQSGLPTVESLLKLTR